MRQGYLRRIRLYLGMLEKPCLCPQGRVLSWPGRIHLYAGVPEGAEVNDHFSGLLAVGGFEVSAAHVGTEVRRVCIKSTVGGACKVRSPWHPAETRVMEVGSRKIVEHATDGDTIVFDTRPGRTYAVLSPSELRLASMRFAAETKVVGRWSFDRIEDGLVPDGSGRGHGAKLVDGATLTPAGKGQALRLAAEKSHARVERTAAFDFAALESFSVEARVNFGPDAPTGMIPIVCSMATRQYCLMLRRGRAKFYISSPRGDRFSFVDGTSVLTDGRWHHVRAVRDAASAELKILVDGKLEATSPDFTTGDFSSDAPITIGAYLWGSHSRFAQGLVDDVQITRLGRMVEPERPVE